MKQTSRLPTTSYDLQAELETDNGVHFSRLCSWRSHRTTTVPSRQATKKTAAARIPVCSLVLRALISANFAELQTPAKLKSTSSLNLSLTSNSSSVLDSSLKSAARSKLNTTGTGAAASQSTLRKAGGGGGGLTARSGLSTASRKPSAASATADKKEALNKSSVGQVVVGAESKDSTSTSEPTKCLSSW